MCKYMYASMYAIYKNAYTCVYNVFKCCLCNFSISQKTIVFLKVQVTHEGASIYMYMNCIYAKIIKGIVKIIITYCNVKAHPLIFSFVHCSKSIYMYIHVRTCTVLHVCMYVHV